MELLFARAHDNRHRTKCSLVCVLSSCQVPGYAVSRTINNIDLHNRWPLLSGMGTGPTSLKLLVYGLAFCLDAYLKHVGQIPDNSVQRPILTLLKWQALRTFRSIFIREFAVCTDHIQTARIELLSQSPANWKFQRRRFRRHSRIRMCSSKHCIHLTKPHAVMSNCLVRTTAVQTYKRTKKHQEPRMVGLVGDYWR